MRWRVAARWVAFPPRNLKKYASFAFLLLLTNCAQAPKVKSTSQPHAFKALAKNMAMRKQVSGTGSIAWVSNSPKHNIAASGVLLLQWPDRLRLEIQDPLGSRLALLVVNGEQAWWEESGAHPIFWAKSAKGLEQLIHLPLGGKDLVQAWLARPELQGFVWQEEGEGETVLVRNSKGPERLVWSNRLSEPEQWVQQELRGAELRIDYEDYGEHDGISMPQSVRFTLVRDGIAQNSLHWIWQDWLGSLPSRADLFEIPQSNPGHRPVKSF